MFKKMHGHFVNSSLLIAFSVTSIMSPTDFIAFARAESNQEQESIDAFFRLHKLVSTSLSYFQSVTGSNPAWAQNEVWNTRDAVIEIVKLDLLTISEQTRKMNQLLNHIDSNSSLNIFMIEYLNERQKIAREASSAKEYYEQLAHLNNEAWRNLENLRSLHTENSANTALLGIKLKWSEFFKKSAIIIEKQIGPQIQKTLSLPAKKEVVRQADEIIKSLSGAHSAGMEFAKIEVEKLKNLAKATAALDRVQLQTQLKRIPELLRSMDQRAIVGFEKLIQDYLRERYKIARFSATEAEYLLELQKLNSRHARKFNESKASINLADNGAVMAMQIARISFGEYLANSSQLILNKYLTGSSGHACKALFGI